LHPNAEQNEGNNAQDAMRSGRRDKPGDPWSVRIAEINEDAKNGYSEKHPNMRQNVS
jgi:hypothetical protein